MPTIISKRFVCCTFLSNKCINIVQIFTKYILNKFLKNNMLMVILRLFIFKCWKGKVVLFCILLYFRKEILQTSQRNGHQHLTNHQKLTQIFQMKLWQYLFQHAVFVFEGIIIKRVNINKYMYIVNTFTVFEITHFRISRMVAYTS